MTKIKAKKKKQQQLTVIEQHWKTAAVCIFCLPFIIYAAMELYFRISYELAGKFTWDSLLYFTVGRGILNGITPWTGLWENKPPGIFLLSALSFKLFDSPVFTFYFQAFVLLLTAAVPIAAFFMQSNYRSVLKLAFATLAGLMLALYSRERSGGVQVESFGAAFACIAIFSMAMPDFEKRKILLTSLSVIGILGACGFKEPFLFPLFGASLILCASVKAWAFRFALPLGIAVLLGLVFLLACGWLDAFLHYLSYMSFSHISGDGSSPFVRAFEIDRLFYDLNALSWGFAIAFFVLMSLPFVLFFANAKRDKNATLIKIALLGMALFLASFSVGLGVAYFNHHYVFALPFYMALVLLLLKNWEGENSAMNKLGLASFVFLAIAVFNFQSMEQNRNELWDNKKKVWVKIYGGISKGQNRNEFWDSQKKIWDNSHGLAIRRVAAYLDSEMDRLGIDRYVYISPDGPNLITGLTKHSPDGTFFFYNDYFLKTIPGYVDSLRATIRRADIIVMSLEWFRGFETLNAVAAESQFISYDFESREITISNDFESRQIGSYNIYIRKNRNKR